MIQTPATLSAFNSYQDEYYRRLLQLPYFDKMAKVIEDFLYKIVSNGSFYLRVPVAALPAIIQTGRIKSMMETGKGTTNGGTETRREVVKALFGCNVDRLAPEEYPKFGYLSQADSKRDLVINADLCYQYGSVALKLKKERMMHRTTLCIGNSVNHARCYTLIPTKVTRLRATCLQGLPHAEASGKQSLISLPDPLTCYMYMTMQILEPKLTADNFPSIDRLLGDEMPFFEYFELQYHGIIDICTDIERIDCIPCFDDDMSALLQAQSEFRKLGVEFYIHS